jgi:hypothetical protein
MLRKLGASVCWIDLAQDHDVRRAFVNAAMNLLVQKGEKLLTE